MDANIESDYLLQETEIENQEYYKPERFSDAINPLNSDKVRTEHRFSNVQSVENQ